MAVAQRDLPSLPGRCALKAGLRCEMESPLAVIWFHFVQREFEVRALVRSDRHREGSEVRNSKQFRKFRKRTWPAFFFGGEMMQQTVDCASILLLAFTDVHWVSLVRIV